MRISIYPDLDFSGPLWYIIPMSSDIVPSYLPALRPVAASAAMQDPAAPSIACAHIANGGDLVTLAKAWGVRYSDLAAWLTGAHSDQYAAALKARAELGREEITREITAIVCADKRELYRDGYLLPPHEWPDEVAKAVQDYQPASATGAARVKMIDKLGALEVMGRLSGVADHKAVEAGPVTFSLTVKIDAPAPVQPAAQVVDAQ